MSAEQRPLTRPLAGLDAWVRYLKAAEIPVFDSSAQALALAREREDEVDASQLSAIVSDDPLMSLKVLIYGATQRSKRMLTDTETLTSTLVMMGIPPFFRAFQSLPVVESWLGGQASALNGLRDTVRRAHRSARFALAFAVCRRDHDAAVIHEAALLHDFAEMLIWCHAPALAMHIRQVMDEDPAIRSADIQRQILNVELIELQQRLMKAWRLPELLVQISDDSHAVHPRVRNVVLAVRLARHSARSWDNAALPDDVTDIARLLNLSIDTVWNLLRECEDTDDGKVTANGLESVS